MVNTLVLLGIAYNNIYEWDRSIKYYKQALHIVEQLQDFSDSIKLIIYNDLGYCSECQNSHYDAIKYYQSALTIHPDNYSVLSNLARTFYKIGDFTEAKNYLNKANHVMKPNEVDDLYIISNNLLSCLLFVEYKDMDEIFTILNTNFPLIIKNRIYEIIIFYSREFGAILEQHKFYKKSNELYKYAFDAYQNLLKGGEKNNV
ncbi:tetratricopeptide repeat protein [Ureibacillus sp. MALMAid1270]|uniref:tetratricopeptide repeat protein n=1 Tax=Ureibacillus sp. MALMAid1270 TaxID=3411629 RepID=UPI003BA50473